MNPSAPHKKKLVVGVASVGGGDHVGIRGPPKGREGKWRGHFLSFFLGWLVGYWVSWWHEESIQAKALWGWAGIPCDRRVAGVRAPFLAHNRIGLFHLSDFFVRPPRTSIIVDPTPPQKKPNNLSLSLALSLPSRKLITRRLQVSTCYLQDALYSCWMNEKCALVCNKNSFLVWENNE